MKVNNQMKMNFKIMMMSVFLSVATCVWTMDLGTVVSGAVPLGAAYVGYNEYVACQAERALCKKYVEQGRQYKQSKGLGKSMTFSGTVTSLFCLYGGLSETRPEFKTLWYVLSGGYLAIGMGRQYFDLKKEEESRKSMHRILNEDSMV
jgi:hypothetical protein